MLPVNGLSTHQNYCDWHEYGPTQIPGKSWSHSPGQKTYAKPGRTHIENLVPEVRSMFHLRLWKKSVTLFMVHVGNFNLEDVS